jgi:hypothetical protein
LFAAPACHSSCSGKVGEIIRRCISGEWGFAAQVPPTDTLADQGWDGSGCDQVPLLSGIPRGKRRVSTTLIYALSDRRPKRGVASLCLGGGKPSPWLLKWNSAASVTVAFSRVGRLPSRAVDTRLVLEKEEIMNRAAYRRSAIWTG